MGEKKPRNLGDFVLCEWDVGKITKHKIKGKTHGVSQSGVMYQVDPPLRLANSDDWIDSDWFFDVATPE